MAFNALRDCPPHAAADQVDSITGKGAMLWRMARFGMWSDGGSVMRSMQLKSLASIAIVIRAEGIEGQRLTRA